MKPFWLLNLFFCLTQNVFGSTCNMTAYDLWRARKYTGKLEFDPTFWRYQNQPQFQIKNDLALQIAYGMCRHRMKSLIDFKAGRLGPIDQQTTYDIMCLKYCLENDAIHESAMAASGCSCLELSTQPGESSYHEPGDWCKHNTARMRCDILGFCGFWECRIDDFMCPRYEYNKRAVQFKGLGSCKGSASKNLNVRSSIIATILTVCCIVILNIIFI